MQLELCRIWSCPVRTSLHSLVYLHFPISKSSQTLPLETTPGGHHKLAFPPRTSVLSGDTPLRNSFSRGTAHFSSGDHPWSVGPRFLASPPFFALFLLHTLPPFSKHRVGQYAPPPSSIEGRAGVGKRWRRGAPRALTSCWPTGDYWFP